MMKEEGKENKEEKNKKMMKKKKLYRVKCGKKDEQLAFLIPNSESVGSVGEDGIKEYVRVRWNTTEEEEDVPMADILGEVEGRRGRRLTQGVINLFSPSKYMSTATTAATTTQKKKKKKKPTTAAATTTNKKKKQPPPPPPKSSKAHRHRRHDVGCDGSSGKKKLLFNDNEQQHRSKKPPTMNNIMQNNNDAATAGANNKKKEKKVVVIDLVSDSDGDDDSDDDDSSVDSSHTLTELLQKQKQQQQQRKSRGGNNGVAAAAASNEKTKKAIVKEEEEQDNDNSNNEQRKQHYLSVKEEEAQYKKKHDDSEERLATANATIEKQKMELSCLQKKYDSYVTNSQTIQQSLRADLDKKQQNLTEASNMHLNLTGQLTNALSNIGKLETELKDTRREALQNNEQQKLPTIMAPAAGAAVNKQNDETTKPPCSSSLTSASGKQEVDGNLYKKENHKEELTLDQNPEKVDAHQASTISNLQASVYSLEKECRTLRQREGELDSELKQKEEQTSLLCDQLDESEARVKQLEDDKQSLQLEVVSSNGGTYATTNMSRLSSLATTQRGGMGVGDLIVDDSSSTNCEHERIEQILAECSNPEISELIHNLLGKNQRLHKRNNLLQSKIHQLRGSFQVCCRIRPMSLKELKKEGKAPAVKPVSETNVICGGKQFSLDSVWGPEQSQQEVFQDVEPLALSVVDGKNACIMAYGQTGSGKTYTMEGVNARAAHTFFRTLERHKQEEKTMGILMKSGSQGDTKPSFEYRIEVSMVEIYNEEVYDLLASGQKATLSILNVGGRTVAKGATKMHITSIEDFMAHVKRGNANRTTAATEMNEQSSRSHMILMVDVCSTSGKVVNKGTLSLVDLAGSERVKKSNVEGDRKKETCNINQSLSTLGKVMLALENKDKHVPYRDSKLTCLLRDCLNGKSSTLLINTLSAVASSAGESLNTLQFATRVAGIRLAANNVPKPKRAPSLAYSTTKPGNLSAVFEEKENDPPETPLNQQPPMMCAATGGKFKKFLKNKLSPNRYQGDKSKTNNFNK